MNLFETEYFVFFLQSLNKFVDVENDLHYECEVVGYNKLNYYWVDKNLVRFFKSLL